MLKHHVFTVLTTHVHDSRSLYGSDGKLLNETILMIRHEKNLLFTELKSLNIEVLRNTNPSLDADVETFENTTHLFACSSDGTPQERQLKTSMFFVHPREWYLGKTMEDRYLFGYDETYFDQELAKDTAVITSSNGEKEFIEFDYFTP